MPKIHKSVLEKDLKQQQRKEITRVVGCIAFNQADHIGVSAGLADRIVLFHSEVPLVSLVT